MYRYRINDAKYRSNKAMKPLFQLSHKKSERIDYARRLERIESLKAKGRMSDGGKGRQKSDNLRTDDSVAEKLGIGSRDTYRKEKYIVENQKSLTTEDFADLNCNS